MASPVETNSMVSNTSHRKSRNQEWHVRKTAPRDASAPVRKAYHKEGLQPLPRSALTGVIQPPGMPLLPLGNLPALLQIASQNPALAEAFQERCETLASANPQLIPFIEELHAGAGMNLIRIATEPGN